MTNKKAKTEETKADKKPAAKAKVKLEETASIAESAPQIPIVAAQNAAPEDIVLTDAEGNRYCKGKDCDQIGVVDGFCRYHYLLFWKKIQVRKKILTDGKLSRYIDELTSRYPDKFLELIRKDLRSEKDFAAAIQEMEIDESELENDFDDENSNDIEEVRGISTDASGGSSSMSDDDY